MSASQAQIDRRRLLQKSCEPLRLGQSPEPRKQFIPQWAVGHTGCSLEDMTLSCYRPRFSALAVATALLAFSGVLCAERALPATVPGLCRNGLNTRVVKVEIEDAHGRLRPDAAPGIALVRSTRWSPNDAERDGASEFEILLSVARLLESHPLAGVIGVGNRNGAFLPAAERALERAASMGLPVVKLAAQGSLPVNPDNLFIEAGSLSSDEARSVLAECLVTLGALPPAADILRPTAKELAAIRAKLTRYQLAFDTRAAATNVAMR